MFYIRVEENKLQVVQSERYINLVALPLARSTLLQNSCALQHNGSHEMEDDKETQAGERLSNGWSANLHVSQVCFERKVGAGMLLETT